ncbi:MAG: hypothetical protein K2X93_27230 [Candidatus Obscuribacterales bacterium]|nr:hypothetical protein [Candidatus Obscuribacterales bacterium]
MYRPDAVLEFDEALMMNPDDPSNELMLAEDMALARALAEYMIEHVYGVQDYPAYRLGDSTVVAFNL